MFEKHHQPILPVAAFRNRVLRFGLLALAITSSWWGIGILGYHYLNNLGWIDSILNAAMILSGMGPVNPLISPAAKLFASFYAITSGVVFIAVAGILFSPIVHRIFHHFHLESETDVKDEG